MRALAQNLLADKTFFIEFHGYLTNHAKHAIVALDKLDAPVSRIQEYWENYTDLTPYNLKLEASKLQEPIKPINHRDWTALRGKKKHWEEMCVYLEEQRQDRFGGETDQLVREYAPNLLGGLAGALTHGIIHLGWSIDAKSDWMTVEGLAYLNYCHLGVDDSKLVDDAVDEADAMESILRIAREWESKELGKAWIAEAKARYNEDFHPELVKAGFQWQLAKVLAQPHSVATDLPKWLSDSSLEQIWKDLYHTCVSIYLATRDQDGNGNFLILHLLTSLWGLEHVCNVIQDAEVERKAMKQYYATLVCLLAASSSGFPSVSSLEQVQKEFPLTRIDDKENFDWAPTVASGIQEFEEHNIKLVYVMKELWNRYDQWRGFSEAAGCFTLTPNVGPRSTSFKA